MLGFEQTQLTLAAMGASGTWAWNIGENSLDVDERFAALHGLDAGQALTGLPTEAFFKAIHPADRARIKIAVAGMMAGAELFSKEFRVVSPDGTTLWMHGRGQCERDDYDQPRRFIGLLVDVTERKRAEERLRIAQTAGGVGTFEFVDGHATAAVSAEFCRLLGLHPASVLPVQTINAVLVPGAQPILPDARSSHVPETLDAEFEIIRNDDGQRRWIARRGEILPEGSGYRLIGVIYDVTKARALESALRDLNETLEERVQREVVERQQTEEALRQAQKLEAIGQLTGGVAHDFNNLLMAISSSLALLSKRLPDDPSLTRLIDNALQGAERGAALTQRMLAFARRQDLSPEQIAVPELLAGMRELAQRTLGPSWPLDFRWSEDLPPVLADPNQLEMALINLLVNARDAAPRGGPISIHADLSTVEAGELTDLAPGHYVRISVIDRGSGMDAETLARATEPFFTTKGVGKGTGLGLSMIHGLARQLEGTFTLQSAIGEGTSATLWLPESRHATPSPGAAPAQPSPPVARHNLNILAVDDDSLILMNTAAFLEDLGHRVWEAASGADALQIIRTTPDLDLLITDHAMPNMTGIQLAEQAVSERSGLPVILATGYGEVPTDSTLRVVKLGKPFSQAELEDAINRAMSE
ncbi:putative two-component system hybrid sensor and regulator [Sphingobium sp. SYK-6]|uniref:hybrid sensor histidine kinase/response regulator n=1 Tax=Sphingobium sp. (strain NBRC 103272 / SYK-6) TaxID=627192 RepID=UPI00022774C9|nr:hybrid sensor histidine kinase/response regulator [Sphingobium sp. SYK-6]BAK66065.1 putative two-component system hybrid sensor and regulator [Sphingobium sp. SYK-6]